MTLLALLLARKNREPSTPAPLPYTDEDGKIVYPHHGRGVVARFTPSGIPTRSTAAWTRMPGRTRAQKRAHLAVLRHELIKRKRALKAES